MSDERVHIEVTDIENSASNMKFGVIVVREFEEYIENNLVAVVGELSDRGCAPQNIEVRTVPKLHDVVIATQFFAQYTDVDGVIIVAPENRVMGILSLMNGIIQIELQWNMVVVIGGVEAATEIVEMVAMQNDMELNAPEELGQRSIS